MENGDETFASPTAAAAEFEFDLGTELTNGGGTTAAKSYDAAEMDALRKAKRDLEEKLAAASHENEFLTMETSRLELNVSHAKKEIVAAEHAAIASEGEAASLRAEVKRLQDLLATGKSDRDAEMGEGANAGAELARAQKEKAALEEEIKALKASAATTGEKKVTAAPSTVAAEVAPLGMVAAAAAGAAATAAIAVVFLNLKRKSLIDTSADELNAEWEDLE